MRDNFKIFAVVFVLIFLSGLIYRFVSKKNLRKKLQSTGIKTTGRVVQCIYKHEMENHESSEAGLDSSQSISSVIVQYKNEENNMVEAHLLFLSNNIIKGDELNIVYLKNNPLKVYPASVLN